MPIDLLAEYDAPTGPVDLLADEPMEQQAPPKSFGRNMLDYEKALGLGLAQGAGDVGASIGNVPSDIWKYFTGNQPYHIPHPALQKYYPEGTAGKIGSSIGETIGNIAVPGGGIFKATRAANNPFIKALLGAGAGGVLGGASNEQDRLGSALTGAALGAGSTVIPSVIQGGKKVVSMYRKPFDKLSEAEKLEQSLSDAMKTRKESFGESKADIGKFLKSKAETQAQQEEALKDSLAQKHPIIPRSETRAALAEQHQKAYGDLQKDFKSRYGEFSKVHGDKPIRATIRYEDFLENTKDLKGLSQTLTEIRKNPAKKIIRYDYSTGETKNIQVPNAGATVDDYIGFMREIRDASYDALTASKNATHAEKMDLLKTHRELKGLQSTVEQKIEDTIGKREYAPFKDIQNDYSKTIGAIKSEPSIAAATYKNKISDSLFSDLLQPRNETLRKHLYSNPKYKETLAQHLLQGAKHPISEGASFNPTKIDADVYKLLSNEQRAAKSEAGVLAQNKEALKNVSSILKDPKTMTAIQEQEVRSFGKEANDFLNRVAHEEGITKQMQEEAKRLNISKQDLAEQVKHRKLMASLAALGVSANMLPGFLKAAYNKLTS